MTSGGIAVVVVSTGAEKPVDDHRIGMPDNKRHRKAKSAVAERSSNALHETKGKNTLELQVAQPSQACSWWVPSNSAACMHNAVLQEAKGTRQ